MVFINFIASEHWLFTSAYLFAYCYHQIIDFLLNTLSDYNIHSSAQNIRMFSTHTMILITISIVMCKTLNAMTHEIFIPIIILITISIVNHWLFLSQQLFVVSSAWNVIPCGETRKKTHFMLDWTLLEVTMKYLLPFSKIVHRWK